MPRIVRDSKIETPTARSKLPARAEPYWRALESGVHLGYRKGKASGRWVLRRYVGGRYQVESLTGIADDTQAPNGSTILDYAGAVAAARAAHALATVGPQSGPYTVRDSMAAYLADYEARGGKGARTVRSAIDAHINPRLGDFKVTALTASKIRAWLQSIASGGRLARGDAKGERKSRPALTGPDAARKRKAAANRIFNVLQAALNHAWRDGKVPSDEAWRKVRRFRDVDAPTIRYLTTDEARRLVNACPPEFRRMVQAALLTGCRYGELASLVCGDFSPDAGTLLIRTSKAGKARHVVLTTEAARFFAGVTAGKSGPDLMFRRPDGESWKHSDQRRPLADACKAAKIKPAIGFHVLRHTTASLLAMAGAPLPVIAEQLGHADMRMTRRYAHLSPSYMADTLRQHMPTLGIVGKSKVMVLSGKRK